MTTTKKQINKPFSSWPLKLSIIWALCLGLVACQEEEEEIPPGVEAEAVEVIEESMSANTGGLAKDLVDLVNAPIPEAETTAWSCGASLDSSFSYTLTGDATGSFEINWIRTLVCDQEVPSSIEGSMEYNGNYNGPNLTRTASGGRSWVLTGLGINIPQFTLNGTGDRVHTRTFQNSGATRTWTLATTYQGILINKESQEIAGGSLSFEATRTGASGETHNFEGQVVFNGGGTATLTINGNTYTITIN